MAAKTVLITGANTGLGNAFALEALSRGYNVIASGIESQGAENLKNCTYLQLDITWPDDKLDAVAAKAWNTYGSIDYLFNNAGVQYCGAVEESSRERLNFQTNVLFLGHVFVTKAFLPYFRKQMHGTIIMTSSVGAYLNSAGNAMYSACKSALMSLTEGLAKELAPFNIRCITLLPGGFATNISKPGSLRLAEKQVEGYEAVRKYEAFLSAPGRVQRGDPHKAAKNVFKLLDQDQLPYALALGDDSLVRILPKVEATLAQLKEYESYGLNTTRDDFGKDGQTGIPANPSGK